MKSQFTLVLRVMELHELFEVFVKVLFTVFEGLLLLRGRRLSHHGVYRYTHYFECVYLIAKNQ